MCCAFAIMKGGLELKSQKFLSKYYPTYKESRETLDGSGYQCTLDKRTNPKWTKKITLKCKESFINKYNQTSYQRLFFAFYEYADYDTGEAAIDSLLNHFPNDDFKIKKNKNMEGLKAIPAIYILNRKEIITCHVHCLQTWNNWENIKNEIIDAFANAESNIITTGCGGPLEWKTKKN